MSEQEEAIFFKLGDKNAYIPTGKTVIEYELSKLMTPEGERILGENLYYRSQRGRKNDSSKKDSGRTYESE